MTTQIAADQHNTPGPEAKMAVAWIGACSGGLEWLRTAVDTNCRMNHLPSDSKASLTTLLQSQVEHLADSQCQRLIIGVNKRLQLNQRIIHQLQTLAGEIPLAIAADSWFDGSRRTGIGETGVLLLPWSRWWDGWLEWLREPARPTMDAWATATAHLTAPEPLGNNCRRSGLVIADCWQTGQSWKCSSDTTLAAMRNVDSVSSRRLGSWKGTPDWILLDDTADYMHVAEANGPARAVSQLRDRFPETLLVVATTICRHDQWLSLQEVRGCETIAKPSTGRSLRNLLHQHFKLSGVN